MKDPDKLKLMLLAWNYNLQQVHAQAQAQAANAALSPNNSSTTTSTTVGTPVTSQSAISTANNTISNSTLTGNTLSHPASDRESRRCDSWKIRLAVLSFISLRVRTQGRVAPLNEVDSSSIFANSRVIRARLDLPVERSLLRSREIFTARIPLSSRIPDAVNCSPYAAARSRTGIKPRHAARDFVYVATGVLGPIKRRRRERERER